MKLKFIERVGCGVYIMVEVVCLHSDPEGY